MLDQNFYSSQTFDFLEFPNFLTSWEIPKMQILRYRNSFHIIFQKVSKNIF